MTHDSLIGFTISNVTMKDASCVSKMSSPSILIINTEMSKRSAMSDNYDFYSKHFIHAFFSNQNLKATGMMIKRDFKMTIKR
jgi:hypothetical protein